jgi:hypothetical protein
VWDTGCTKDGLAPCPRRRQAYMNRNADPDLTEISMEITRTYVPAGALNTSRHIKRV